MLLDDALFDTTEDLDLDSWICSDPLAGEETWGNMEGPVSEPMLVSQRMPSEEDLKAIEAQANYGQEAYFEDRRSFRSPNLYVN
jgi:hypothetical protein